MTKMKQQNTTTLDVARAASVSVATVDRVINGRSGVRHETRERVNAAIERLDFRRDARAASLARGRTYRFLFILPSRQSSFAQSLVHAVEFAPAAFVAQRIETVVEKVEMTDVSALFATLNAIEPADWDGIAVKATDAPGIREALDDLVDKGLPVVTLVSDIPSSKRQVYVGIDNTAAGRVAGSLMGRFLQGREGAIGIMAGSLMMRDHVERRIGFEQVLKTEYPALAILPVAESADDRDTAGRIVERMLEAHPDLLGIYSISAGNRGILSVLRERKPTPRPILIVHELSPHVRRALLEGDVDVAINQSADLEAQRAVAALIALSEETPTIGGHDRVEIGVFLRDNLP
jgi:LacI family transcriptional regulator